MGKIRQINLKNQTYCFYDDEVDLKDFDAKLLKIDQKNYNEIDFYYNDYVNIKKIGDYNNINSVNPLYLIINEMIGHVEVKNENKYLVLDEIDENKEVLRKYEEVWKGIKKEIETINSVKKVEYWKDFKQIRFESNENLPLNRVLKFYNITIIIRSVFSGNGKFYTQLFLHDALYEL